MVFVSLCKWKKRRILKILFFMLSSFMLQLLYNTCNCIENFMNWLYGINVMNCLSFFLRICSIQMHKRTRIRIYVYSNIYYKIKPFLTNNNIEHSFWWWISFLHKYFLYMDYISNFVSSLLALLTTTLTLTINVLVSPYVISPLLL